MSPTLRNKKSLDPGGKNKPEEIAARDNDVDREDQNADQEYLDIGVDEDLFAGEKEETSSNRISPSSSIGSKDERNACSKARAQEAAQSAHHAGAID